jgi:hypothetical protein
MPLPAVSGCSVDVDVLWDMVIAKTPDQLIAKLTHGMRSPSLTVSGFCSNTSRPV